MEELIKFNTYPVSLVLKKLLQDRTTGKNIIFASESYQEYGYTESSEITEQVLSVFSPLDLQPRVFKDIAEQSDRTRKKAEVFTPTWIVKKMNDLCIEECFTDWKKAVDCRILEITCGEAPFLVSRYDATTGEPIPIGQRVGILDKKLQLICENTDNAKDWLKYAKKAYKSTYGYEFQGDNLLIARINLLVTFCEYYAHKFGTDAEAKEVKAIAEILTWNLWQMDGLQDTVPFGEPEEQFQQLSLFDAFEMVEEQNTDCLIKDWKANTEIKFKDLKEGNVTMKFDFVIGNPPYQDDKIDNGRKPPIYNLFMDAAFNLADKVELIHPARFLFNAGQTPKKWNEKMLSDTHFKVLLYEPDGAKIFPTTEIKGGIAITYRDKNKKFDSIDIFTPYNELNTIIPKVSKLTVSDISDIVSPGVPYKFSDTLRYDHPELNEIIGSTYDLRTNILDKLNDILFFDSPQSEKNWVQIFGLKNKKRSYLWIDKKYLITPDNFESYKILLPESNGNGTLGEALSTPLIGNPLIGHTQSFISIGNFTRIDESENCLKYIKSKFARTMLGVLKITQHNPKDTWKYVPLQDFTENSDIDWTKSIAEIDQQLYKKYNLSQEEIDFIESHVKEME